MLNSFLKELVIVVLWVGAVLSLVLTGANPAWWAWIPWLTVGVYLYGLFRNDMKKRLFGEEDEQILSS